MDGIAGKLDISQKSNILGIKCYKMMGVPHTHGAHNANGGITAPQTEEIVSLLRVHVSSGSVSEVARMKLDPSCFLVDDIFSIVSWTHFFPGEDNYINPYT